MILNNYLVLDINRLACSTHYYKNEALPKKEQIAALS